MMYMFKVGEEVFARVKSFQPFPGVVDSVLLTESDCSVFYYVRLRGASETVPLDSDCLLKYAENKHVFKHKYSDRDLRRESQLRVDALLGAEDEIPDVLLNFVTVDSDFEVVSEEAVKNLGLCSIILSPRMVEDIDKGMSQKRHLQRRSEEDDFVDVEDIESDRNSGSKPKLSESCSTCSRKFKTRMALKAHQRQNAFCRLTQKRQIVKSSKVQADIQRSNTAKNELQISGADRKGNDQSTVNKSKWASRSASGYYPCKLCFRKFRSIGEAQLHISMHKNQITQKGLEPDLSEGSNTLGSEDSISLEDDDESKVMHNCMERHRRAEQASKFANLSEVIGVEKGCPKVKVLSLAKTKIHELEKEAEDLNQTLGYLTEMNAKLKARYLSLDSEER